MSSAMGDCLRTLKARMSTGADEVITSLKNSVESVTLEFQTGGSPGLRGLNQQNSDAILGFE